MLSLRTDIPCKIPLFLLPSPAPPPLSLSLFHKILSCHFVPFFPLRKLLLRLSTLQRLRARLPHAFLQRQSPYKFKSLGPLVKLREYFQLLDKKRKKIL